MGAWGEGVLESDGALDVIGRLTDAVLVDVRRAATRSAPTEADAARLGAEIGLLIAHYEYAFVRDGEAIAEAARRHLLAARTLSDRAREVVAAVATGQGTTFTAGEARSDLRRRALGGARTGRVEMALFEHPVAIARVQEFAERAAVVIDDWCKVSDEDLYGVGFMGAVALLLETGPWRLERRRIEAWREALRAADARTTDERGFFDGYMKNAEATFEMLLERA